jgi:hypothetical protein
MASSVVTRDARGERPHLNPESLITLPVPKPLIVMNSLWPSSPEWTCQNWLPGPGQT